MVASWTTPATVGEVGGDVVLEAVLADVAEQLLQARDFDHAGAAESFERIVGERALADVAADLAVRDRRWRSGRSSWGRP